MVDKRKEIAVYGKGGIGKSAMATNLSIALQEKGRKVMQVGCSPKIDSTAYLIGGEVSERPLLAEIRSKGKNRDVVMDCIYHGYNGVLCVESGGPVPGEGCAGIGVGNALDILTEYQVFEELERDTIIYDVLGDVVCGGFSQPIRGQYAEMVYLVTSGELMSLYAANNVCISIADMSRSTKVRVGGIINNMRGVKNEIVVVEEFARRIKVPVLINIPRTAMFIKAEAEGGSVLQFFPQSKLANLFRQLADFVLEEEEGYNPEPITLEEIKDILREYQVAG